MQTRVAACLALAAASPAFGDIVEMNFAGTGRGQTVHIVAGAKSMNAFAGQLLYNVSAGEGRGEALIGSHVTFCTDLYEYASSRTLEYRLANLAEVPDSAPMSPRTASAVRDLFAYAGGAQFDTHTSNDYATAFQIALWEVVSDYDWREGASSLSLDDGWFRASKTNGQPLASGVMSHVESLFGAVGSHSGSPGLVAFRSESAQDQLASIPTPGSTSVVLAGFVLAASRRRR